MASGAIDWTRAITIGSLTILVGTELVGIAWASGWAIASLFQLGDTVARVLQGSSRSAPRGDGGMTGNGFSDYPRDMRGYGRTTPDPRWPGGARVCVQFVLNYEEGGENNILHGDPHSEAFLSEII
eukprot:gene51504-68922_t